VAAAVVPESLAAVMRREIVSTFTQAHARQDDLLGGRDFPIDTFTYHTRGRFTAAEVDVLLRSVDEIAHPYGRAAEAAAAVTFEEAGLNHGWPSYRAAVIAPTDGAVALAISWRFTIPYRDTVISEIENLWRHSVGEPLVVAPPRPEHDSIIVGETALNVGPDLATVWMRDGIFDPGLLDSFLQPRVYTNGGVELLSDAEIDLLQRVMRALVAGDRAVLEEVGAYANGADPYVWTRDYGVLGAVHFVMPPGEPADWRVSVMQVDDAPGVSFLVVEMWTREEGASDLSLEINLYTDTLSGSVRGEFIDLHVV
jgi:hypothetical protein